MATSALAKRKEEKNKAELRSLTQHDDNKICMDCPNKGPQYAVLNFDIFVCETCAAVHRGLQHKVKGITMSQFTDEEMEGLRKGGNTKAMKSWRGSWNRAVNPMPKEGDEKAMREFIKNTYVDRRWYVTPSLVEEAPLPPVQKLTTLIGPGAPPVAVTQTPPQHALQPPAPPPMTIPAAQPVPQAPPVPAPVQQQPPAPPRDPMGDLFTQPPTVTRNNSFGYAPQQPQGGDAFFGQPQPQPPQRQGSFTQGAPVQQPQGGAVDAFFGGGQAQQQQMERRSSFQQAPQPSNAQLFNADMFAPQQPQNHAGGFGGAPPQGGFGGAQPGGFVPQPGGFGGPQQGGFGGSQQGGFGE
eukprot:PhF_6_TR1506/c0_g1_i1/m.2730/K15044/AGFG1; Arf-GAP domain and FG repeats-containing protein 1